MSVHGNVHPSQTTHFTESVLAYCFGFGVTVLALFGAAPVASSGFRFLAGHIAGICCGITLTGIKEGEDFWVQYKNDNLTDEVIAGEFVDIVVHTAGFTIPAALVWLFVL